MKYYSHQNFNKNEIQNAVVQVSNSDPTSPVNGQIYYNSTTKRLRQYDGTSWIEYGTGTGTATGDVTQAANSGGAGRMKVSAGATKEITDYAGGAGLVKADGNGVVSPASPGTDYVTRTSTDTLTNKTFDANATGNSLSNVEVADFAASAVNSSTTLAGATNSQVPTAAAVKAYADALIAANDALVFKGGIDASTNPNYPAADAGHLYRITAAGKIGGASGVDVQVSDTIICTVDGTPAGTQAAVGTNWIVLQANVDRATTTTLGLTEHATPAEAEARTATDLAVTPAGLANYGLKKAFTIGDGAATSIAVTHNLGSLDVIVQVREVSTNDVIECDIKMNSASQVTLSFASAPAANSLRVVVMG